MESVQNPQTQYERHVEVVTAELQTLIRRTSGRSRWTYRVELCPMSGITGQKKLSVSCYILRTLQNSDANLSFCAHRVPYVYPLRYTCLRHLFGVFPQSLHADAWVVSDIRV